MKQELSKAICQRENQPLSAFGQMEEQIMAEKVVIGKTSKGENVFYKTNDGDARPATRQATYTEEASRNTRNDRDFNPSTGKFIKR